MKTITISKDQLQAALRDWEQEHRDGKCMSIERTAALTVEQVAAASAANLWVALGGEAED